MENVQKETRVELVIQTLRFLNLADDLIGSNVWAMGSPWTEENTLKCEIVRSYIEPFIPHFDRLVKETGITSHIEWEDILKEADLLDTGSMETLLAALV